MTNKQAIETIEILKAFLSYPKDDYSNVLNTLDLAIKALKIDDRRKYIISVYESYKQTAPVREVIEVLKECEGE